MWLSLSTTTTLPSIPNATPAGKLNRMFVPTPSEHCPTENPPARVATKPEEMTFINHTQEGFHQILATVVEMIVPVVEEQVDAPKNVAVGQVSSNEVLPAFGM